MASGRLAVSFILAMVCLFIFSEYGIYYAVILRCYWPDSDSHSDVRALVLSDTHLLGNIKGHWFDKLRREWQMERAFQTSLWLFKPEVVFILGDVFDEGKWSSPEDWEDDVRRFKRIFRHPRDTELVVLIGNHDIGFHYEMTPQKLERFEQVFNVTSARILTIREVNFLLVNSVALHGDHCPICQRVENELYKLSQGLNCSIQGTEHDDHCKNTDTFAPTAPILLQHYPLYRVSDAMCTGVDAAPMNERYHQFHERYDVISQVASKKLLWWFRPRLILSGHTHSGCEVVHENRYPEVSVPSFNWRNRNNPSFILGLFSRSDFRLSKCFLPEERSIIALYCGSGLTIALIVLGHLKLFRRPLHFTILGKHKTL
ncbi:Metallophosphoesterase 1 [Triplophysa tibetana]|uniref:Metallophosphoesterase 1 n=1 Tax=Triplophysa tibetana TaxID=1572043 RepID=A0A5A9N9N3_9TELE|nr:Metallophosphoesterase 1 [Triplophysa tibetana]